VTGIAVRIAALDDAALLARLHAECFDEAWDEAAFAAFLRDPHAFALIAREDQAFALVRTAADECEILTLCTQPDRRRLGFARALIEAGAAEAHRRGARRMFLEVASDNEAALSLYGSAGFAPIGRRPDYYVRAGGSAADAVVLAAALPL
jgi:ribosomal-protein-alanine N-acetyltransferase